MFVVSFESEPTKVVACDRLLEDAVLAGRGGSDALEVVVGWDEERSEKRWVSFSSAYCQHLQHSFEGAGHTLC